MRYEEHPPPPELRGLVHRIWLLHGMGAGEPFQRAMPDGRAELILNLAEAFQSREGTGSLRLQPASLLIGPTRRAMRIRPTGVVDLVGVRLRPEALSGWLRLPAAELVDRVLELNETSAGIDRALPDRLAGARTSGERVAIICRHLAGVTGRIPQRRTLAAAVDLALSGGRRRPISIADAVGMSYRQLARLFRDRIGLGPKLLVRLARFQRVLHALESPPPGSLAGIALRAGYFDQAHLTRDFQAFAGVSPGRYLRENREVTRNFITDPGDSSRGRRTAPDSGSFFQDGGRPAR